MKTTVGELRSIVENFNSKIRVIPEEEFSAKPLPHKWSKKEVIGHLIDSAHNNLRRFICGQYETVPSKIVYDQDYWVIANRYQNMKKEDILLLWRMLNERIAVVLEHMPEENYTKQSETSARHTLEWLAIDYVKHMKHHLNQVISGSFEIVYP